MGVTNDVADYFRRSPLRSPALWTKVVMFLNLSNDPIIERILTPALRLDRGGDIWLLSRICTCW